MLSLCYLCFLLVRDIYRLCVTDFTVRDIYRLCVIYFLSFYFILVVSYTLYTVQCTLSLDHPDPKPIHVDIPTTKETFQSIQNSFQKLLKTNLINIVNCKALKMSSSPVTPERRPRENEISKAPGAPRKSFKQTHHAVCPIPIGAPLGHRTGAMWNEERFDGRVIVTPWAWSKLNFNTSFEAGKKACEEKFRTILMSKKEFLEKRSLCHTVDEATYRIIKENEREGIIVAPKPLASTSVTATLQSKKRSLDVSQDEGEPVAKKAKTNVTTTTTKSTVSVAETDKNPFDELMEDAVQDIQAKSASRKLANAGACNETSTSTKYKAISLVSDSEDEFSEDEDRSPSPDVCSRTIQIVNRCIECGVDMGDCNPRQYCGKTHCLSLQD